MSKFSRKPKTGTLKKVNHICLYADFGCTTGFGNVTKELIDRWQKKLNDSVKLIVFSINDQNPEPYDYGKAMIVPGHTQAIPGTTDFLYREAFINFILQSDYNVVMFINDIDVVGSMNPYIVNIHKYKKKAKRLRFKTILYFPIDSLPKLSDVEGLKLHDELVAYTEYGKETVINMVPELSKKLQIIPHGVDSNTFFEIKDKESVQIEKEAIFGKDKFVIGNVNRNSARKDIATTILAFHKLITERPITNAVLYLHMNPKDTAGLDIVNLCNRLQLEIGKDVFFPKGFSENIGFDPKRLNMIYNCLDVFLTTTTAEGWGLTVTEAMASRVQIIAPMHTSLVEITDNGQCCLPIRIMEEIVFLNDGEKVRYKSDIRQIFDALSICYYNTSAMPYVENAYQKTKQYNWDTTAAKFWDLIQKQLK